SHVDPKRLVVVFNDNGWSISDNLGWVTCSSNRIILDPKDQRFTTASHHLLSHLPYGSKAWEGARRIKTSVESLILPKTIWEELVLHYIGPVDGHNQQELEEALRVARDASREAPVVVHALTHKGRGYPQAEENPSKFHQPGTPSASADSSRPCFTYSQVFAKTLI